MSTARVLSLPNAAFVVLAGVACTTVVGLPDLPEPSDRGSNGGTAGSVSNGGSGKSGGAAGSISNGGTAGSVSNGGTGKSGGAAGSISNGGTAGSVSNGGTAETGGSVNAGGDTSGGSTGAEGGEAGTSGTGGNGAAGASGAGTSTGGDGGGGMSGVGGSSGSAGSTSGGKSGAAGAGGGTGGSAGGGTSGTGGTAGSPGVTDGPCDIYADASTPCVGAYSTIRRLSSTYSGPLYQVRSGSSAQNTGSGGVLHDIGTTTGGFADAAAQDSICSGTTCTIARLYDQSGNGNDLTVAKKGRPEGGEFADDDDFESLADADALMVDGHSVYALLMDKRQGYRLPAQGALVPLGTAAQGIYMLADGTSVGTACCWEFGNVTEDPTQFHAVNSLFFGTAYWGQGANSGPWFMADFDAGIWAGGSNPGDPGWGGLTDPGDPNLNNPSLKVPFALGFLKTDATNYALRMANAQTATTLTTAYQGALPKTMDNQGAIVLGVGADNSNNSKGTFYEGAVLSGFPSNAAEQAVLDNIKDAGYGL